MSVYERIRTDVIVGKFAPGTPLIETSLARDYGISRTPIREALLRLEHDGLVERGARGLSVRASSPQEILDIYEARITLEAAAARAAAGRRTELDLVRLKGVHEAMMAVNEDDSASKAETNHTFHEAIWDASHNPTLVDLLFRLNVHLLRYPTTTLADKERWKDVLAEHAELIAAIESRDEKLAFDLAEHHMVGARQVRLRMYGDQV